MATFPSYLKLLRDGFTYQPAALTSRTPFEDGLVKQSRTKTRALVQRHVAYAAESNADFQSWQTFFDTTINGGADWFDWTDPIDSTVKQARIVGSYQADPAGAGVVRWRISMILETWSS